MVTVVGWAAIRFAKSKQDSHTHSNLLSEQELKISFYAQVNWNCVLRARALIAIVVGENGKGNGKGQSYGSHIATIILLDDFR